MVLIQEKILDKLKCFQCSEYLSYSPVCINENGDSYCGKCSIESGKYSINKAYENLAAMMEFPCRFKKDGCPKVLVWNEADDHENDCGYIKIACPICHCKSEILSLLKHYQSNHRESIVTNEFIYKIDIAKEIVLNYLTEVQDLIFLIRIKCSILSNSINYSVLLLKNTEINSKYKFILNFVGNSETALTKTKIISPQKNFERNPENAISISISALGAIFGNLQNIISTFTIKRFQINCSQCDDIISDFNANAKSSDILCTACTSIKGRMIECNKQIYGCSYASEEQYLALHKQWLCKYASENCKFCKSAYDKISKIEHLEVCESVTFQVSNDLKTNFILSKPTFLKINVNGEVFYSLFFMKSMHLSIYVIRTKEQKNEAVSLFTTILSGNFNVKNKRLETSTDANYWKDIVSVGNISGPCVINLVIRYRKLTKSEKKCISQENLNS